MLLHVIVELFQVSVSVPSVSEITRVYVVSEGMEPLSVISPEAVDERLKIQSTVFSLEVERVYEATLSEVESMVAEPSVREGYVVRAVIQALFNKSTEPLVLSCVASESQSNG